MLKSGSGWFVIICPKDPCTQRRGAKCPVYSEYHRGFCGLSLAGAWLGEAQAENATQTMRPVIRGSQYAATSMSPEATQAAERILRAGGNAFDAIVAGQAVLALVDAAGNGIGSERCCWYTMPSRGRYFPSTRKGRRRNWPRSTGTRKIWAVNSRLAMDCFPARYPGWSMPGTRCLIDGER